MDKDNLILAVLLPILFVLLIIIVVVIFRRFRFRDKYSNSNSSALKARIEHYTTPSTLGTGKKEFDSSWVESGGVDPDAEPVVVGEYSKEGGRWESNGTRSFANGWFGLDNGDPGLGSMNSATKGRHHRLDSTAGDEWDTSIDPHDDSPFEKPQN